MSEGARGITAIKDAPAGSWLWPRLFFFFLIMIPPCPVGTEELVTQRAGSSVLPTAAVLWLAFLMAVVPVSCFFFWIFFLALRPPKRDLFSFLPVSPLCPF